MIHFMPGTLEPRTGVPLAPEIDWEKIAMKFALTGGYIKHLGYGEPMGTDGIFRAPMAHGNGWNFLTLKCPR